MAKEQEQQQVEQKDPITESTEVESISVEPEQVTEGAETSEEVNWEAEAKKFQSMYDKKTAEHENLRSESQDLLQLRDTINSKPELVDVIEKQLSGQSDAGKENSTIIF